MSQTLQRILDEVKSLSDLEKRQLATMIRDLNDSLNASSPDWKLEQALALEGLLSLPVPLPSGTSPVQLAPALPVRGRPFSEVLVQERR